MKLKLVKLSLKTERNTVAERTAKRESSPDQSPLVNDFCNIVDNYLSTCTVFVTVNYCMVDGSKRTEGQSWFKNDVLFRCVRWSGRMVSKAVGTQVQMLTDLFIANY